MLTKMRHRRDFLVTDANIGHFMSSQNLHTCKNIVFSMICIILWQKIRCAVIVSAKLGAGTSY